MRKFSDNRKGGRDEGDGRGISWEQFFREYGDQFTDKVGDLLNERLPHLKWKLGNGMTRVEIAKPEFAGYAPDLETGTTEDFVVQVIDFRQWWESTIKEEQRHAAETHAMRFCGQQFSQDAGFAKGVVEEAIILFAPHRANRNIYLAGIARETGLKMPESMLDINAMQKFIAEASSIFADKEKVIRGGSRTVASTFTGGKIDKDALKNAAKQSALLKDELEKLDNRRKNLGHLTKVVETLRGSKLEGDGAVSAPAKPNRRLEIEKRLKYLDGKILDLTDHFAQFMAKGTAEGARKALECDAEKYKHEFERNQLRKELEALGNEREERKLAAAQAGDRVTSPALPGVTTVSNTVEEVAKVIKTEAEEGGDNLPDSVEELQELLTAAEEERNGQQDSLTRKMAEIVNLRAEADSLRPKNRRGATCKDTEADKIEDKLPGNRFAVEVQDRKITAIGAKIGRLQPELEAEQNTDTGETETTVAATDVAEGGETTQADGMTLKEFMSALKESNLSDDDKGQLRKRAVVGKDLSGAIIAFTMLTTEVVEETVVQEPSALEQFIAQVDHSNLPEDEKQTLKAEAETNLGYAQEMLEALTS